MELMKLKLAHGKVVVFSFSSSYEEISYMRSVKISRVGTHAYKLFHVIEGILVGIEAAPLKK